MLIENKLDSFETKLGAKLRLLRPVIMLLMLLVLTMRR